MIRVRKRICLYALLFLIGGVLITGCSRGSKSEDSTQDSAQEEAAQGQIGNLNIFRAFSVDDQSFTEEDFGDYQVTMVVYWAPWSDASLYELQRFDEFVGKLPDRVGFVTVAMDDTAKNINAVLKDLNMTDYTTLISGDRDFKVRYDEIENVPTTIFVDHEGTLIGGPIIGIQEDFEKTYLAGINKALKSIKKKTIQLETEEADQKESDQEETDQEETTQKKSKQKKSSKKESKQEETDEEESDQEESDQSDQEESNQDETDQEESDQE